MRGFFAIAGFLAIAFITSVGLAEPVRILIAASREDGQPGERPLRHADRDAAQVRDTFVRLGGVAPERALLLVAPTGAQLLSAVDRAVALAAGRPAEDVSIVFYFSGHGERDAIHLGAETIPIAMIESRLPPEIAALRIVVLDACRTSDGRPKGFSAAPPFAITLPERDSAQGLVRIQASADGEVAQESDELEGAVFTHYWVTGLAGAADVNGDGRITLGESYSYAYQQTLWRSASSSGVVQRPTAVLDVHEAAPLILTRTTGASALRFPLSSDARYVVYAVGSQTVVGDLWGSPDRRIALAVASGRYMVHRRGSGGSGAVVADVVLGQVRDLQPSDFRPVPEDVLSRKGGEVVLSPDEVGVAYSLRHVDGLVDWGQELAVQYAHDWGGWALVAGIHGGLGTLETSEHDARLTWLGFDALFERRQPLARLTLRMGAGPVVETVFQTVRRTDAAGLAQTPYASERSLAAPTAGGRLAVSLRAPLASRVWIEARLTADVLAVRMDDTVAAAVAVGGGAGAGVSF